MTGKNETDVPEEARKAIAEATKYLGMDITKAPENFYRFKNLVDRWGEFLDGETRKSIATQYERRGGCEAAEALKDLNELRHAHA